MREEQRKKFSILRLHRELTWSLDKYDGWSVTLLGFMPGKQSAVQVSSEPNTYVQEGGLDVCLVHTEVGQVIKGMCSPV